ncbi:NAD(P)H-dependent glycerol-3-phosphate dehydrogenase [Furfurilactobacillus rossiae]|uniref:Glycerol-3-phosphate dehydrogenase [NAD(P)+] n=1 Tax=Furfurilactobacillus rossiae DSM 15814 TaxID=1114972 RepID=A0A0R1RNE8_9LACO|nr:NAD(P)H-dependent glycerol-3-phosphate dehydrogenase [Furfurilactobacillus rossiae]KRL56532.1 glycerol-3-phosphate dehydrogenase [Furfurilactobacillus rossiae DSM 15814]QFR66560.1 NAD(P)H-dependent glycerol-3-phosphate dehydrogenase [Furfurilactobacillus rossiae]QLE62029.1 Glycerol-3-phosphate dehydrogenase NADP [Furfurilactobacillus rossiae]
MTTKIAVLGAGSWGSVLANLLTENGQTVALWSHKASQVEEMNQHHTNQAYMPGFEYQHNLVVTDDMAEAIKDASVVLFVVPTKAIREVSAQAAKLLIANHQKVTIVHAIKGLEQETYKRVSEMLTEEIPSANRDAVVVLSGPSHAEDVAKKDITLITAASLNEDAARKVQKLFMNSYFRVYTNTDVIGAEFGAALKNIIAIGAGALHGLGYGDNAKAALMTRGLAEISRLGQSFGANPLTFIGLSGVGDLIVTATSSNSRNWRAGNELGQGKSLQEVIDTMGMVIEGVATTKAAHELAIKRHVDMPITDAIYDVLYNGAEVRSVITGLMQREGRAEIG